jgi:hypothetical protein
MIYDKIEYFLKAESCFYVIISNMTNIQREANFQRSTYTTKFLIKREIHIALSAAQVILPMHRVRPMDPKNEFRIFALAARSLRPLHSLITAASNWFPRNDVFL